MGEAGWEITTEAADVRKLYTAFINEGAAPCGLFAQTSMRIEKGFCAIGHELDSDLSPMDTGLGLFTRKDGGFTGFEAMQTKLYDGAHNKVVSLLCDDTTANPLGHEPVYKGEKIIGTTSSCAYGYRVAKPVALAHVSSQLYDNERVQIDLAGTRYGASVCIRPVYDPQGQRMKQTTT